MPTKGRDISPPPIFIVSGGTGTSGEQVVNTVLAQFPDIPVPVVTIRSVRNQEQLENVITQAKEQGGTIVHTMVDSQLRQRLIELAQERDVTAIDLMGELLDRLTAALGQPPLEKAGLYRQLHRPYFERIEAIEYALKHDDGQNREGWREADVLLVGVSRTGKTPLSIYLSVLGWKIANLPIVLEIPTPPELYKLEPARVIGLKIDLDRLLAFRRRRVGQLGIPAQSAYTDPERIEEELRLAQSVFRKGGYYTIDVTDKTVEVNADEVIKRISQIK
jgi:[pyruvate, water dikinase]-phosphate phosphotransferase / [pyruvate, water dikinase] kinase